jgi:hypothetical protein
VVEGFWKGDGNLRSVVDEVYDTSSRLPGSKVGEILVYVGLRCRAGLPSAWLGFPELGGGGNIEKVNKTNHILLNVIEISYSRYFSL